MIETSLYYTNIQIWMLKLFQKLQTHFDFTTVQQLFEKRIYSRVNSFVCEYNLIPPLQYMFQRGRFTEQPVSDLIDILLVF